VVVEASVQGGTHLEIRREGVLCASVAFDAMRTSCISGERVFGFAPHEDPKLGLLLHFEDGASFSEFLDQLPAGCQPTSLARMHPSAVSDEQGSDCGPQIRACRESRSPVQSLSRTGRSRHVVDVKM